MDRFEREIDFDVQQGTLEPNTEVQQLYTNALRRALEAYTAASAEPQAADSPSSQRINPASQLQEQQSDTTEPAVTFDQPSEINSSIQQLTEFENGTWSYEMNPTTQTASAALGDFFSPSSMTTNLQNLRMDQLPGPTTMVPLNTHTMSHESLDFTGIPLAQPQPNLLRNPVPNSNIPPLVEYAADFYLESIPEEANGPFGFEFDFNTLSSPAQEPSSVHHEPARQISDDAHRDNREFNLYGDVGIDPITSLLDAENDMSAGTASWKKKSDGNKALSKP
jgi:hypothetical protein